jgi:PAS domain S-box-containing protein
VRPWFRTASPARLALPALIALLSIAGCVVVVITIRGDREAAAARRVQIQSVRADGVLGRARAYVVGLGSVLSGEQAPSQRRFAELAGSTARSAGLVDALWVETVPDSRRRRYERGLGGPITRLTRSGRYERAPRAASYLPATFTSNTRPELRRGVDVSGWPALAAAIRDRASIFAVSASGRGSLGGEPGFYLLQTARFGRAPERRGFLVLFVPAGWLTATLEQDPRRVAINLDGRRLEGGLDSAPAASAGFEALARRWRIDVGSEPPSGLQSILPWLALAWPIATALFVFLLARTIARRRRAERDFARMFNLSLDLLCISGFDGYFKRVNPAFERTLGYSSEELVSRPFIEFVHPDDRGLTSEADARLSHGDAVTEFENRYICADGSVRWLQWSSRPVPDERVQYGVAKDVTDRKRAEAEQAALRRVATLVAHGVSPTTVFGAVCEEVGRLLGASSTSLIRYEADGTATVVAGSAEDGVVTPAGTALTLEGESVAVRVLRTGRAARTDGALNGVGSVAAVTGASGRRSCVGAPIVVDDRLWGVMIATWTGAAGLSADTENRMAQFTELVATAIANADSRTQLAASRARILDAADEERRRVVRDLHDGAQQRLVHTVVTLKLAREALEQGGGEAEDLVHEALENAQEATTELRELAQGIHPAILARGGLRAAVESLVSRLPMPVAYDVYGERLPAAIEGTAYFAVNEALTNAVKHSGARSAEVRADLDGDVLRIVVHDDGAGGAKPGRGSGLIGLRDRVESLGGRMVVVSPQRGGTSLRVDIPVSAG